MRKIRRKSVDFWVSLVTWKGPKGSWRRGFNFRQQRLIELLADSQDLRTKREKSLLAGYNAGEVYRLQKWPEFRVAVLMCGAENLPNDSNIADIVGRTIGRARWGLDHHGARAAELILELSKADNEARAESG
jgi:hypothetical protein